jgi:hypothetical protein
MSDQVCEASAPDSIDEGAVFLQVPPESENYRWRRLGVDLPRLHR